MTTLKAEFQKSPSAARRRERIIRSSAFLSPWPSRPGPHQSLVVRGGFTVIQRPIALNPFEFVVVAGLRAAQLARGCTPRVTGSDKITVTAQAEVAEGKVVREADLPDGGR
jgi:DNA-directed RNA polymerase subunit K/omega